MAIVDEITRLQSAKSDLKTSINAKTDVSHKITIETIDEYADFVDSIETGGTYQSKSVIPTTSSQVITADEGYDALSSVSVSGVTSSIDNNIVAENIKKDVSILGITGNYEGSSGGEYFRSNVGNGNANYNAGMWIRYVEELNVNEDNTLTNVSNRFNGFNGSIINLNKFNFSTTDISSMFRNCYMLTTINGIENFDFSRIVNYSYMFGYCESLPSNKLIEYLSYFNTRNNYNINMSGMFQAIGDIINNYSLDFSSLTNFLTEYCNNISYMFDSAKTMISLKIPNFTFLYRVNVSYMFNGCRALMHLDIRGIDFSMVGQFTSMFGASGTGVPDNCEIIVKDNDAKTWVNTNFSRLTNVKTVAEYEAE